MSFDSGDDNSYEGNDITDTTDTTSVTDATDAAYTPEAGDIKDNAGINSADTDKSIELVSSVKSDINEKSSELVESNEATVLSKSTELCESVDRAEEVAYTKTNENGEKLEGTPTLRDETFAKRDENGEILLDRNGNPVPDFAGQAPNNGFKESPEELEKSGSYTLSKGLTVVRYGSERGYFVTDPGTPYSSLSLPYDKNSIEYHKYIINSDIACTKGTVAPAFGEKGGGVQYMTNDSISDLIELGVLTRKR